MHIKNFTKNMGHYKGSNQMGIDKEGYNKRNFSITLGGDHIESLQVGMDGLLSK